MSAWADISVEPWAMEPDRLAAFVRTVQSLDLEAATKNKSPVEEPTGYELRGSTAVVPIAGTLMKRVPAWARYFGLNCTDTTDLRSTIEKASEDPRVKRILLHVSSPGGQAAGVLEAADAIYAARSKRRVDAVVDGIAASGGYWLAAQANTISAPPDSLVGSIGVYQVVFDTSKAAEADGVKVHVVRSGEHKGMGVPGAPVTGEQLAMAQRVVDGLAALFEASVSRGRGRTAEQVKAIATGAVWLASDAHSQGLVDRVEPVSVAFARLAPQETIMSEKTTASDEAVNAAKAQAAAIEEAKASERKRHAALKAAFPEDPEFAAAQFEAGASVEQASVAYVPVLQKKLREQAAKAPVASTAPAPAASVAPPVLAGGSPETSGTDFMAEARAYSERRKVPMLAAMQAVAREKPELHRAFKADAANRGAAINARKKTLGMA